MGEIRVATMKAESRTLFVDNKFENTLENMQKSVGGYIEALTLYRNDETDRQIVLWLNEEGKLNNLKQNILLLDDMEQVLDVIVGDVLITSVDATGDTDGLTDVELEYVRDAIALHEDVNVMVKVIQI